MHSYHQTNKEWCAAVFKLLQFVVKAGTDQIMLWENNILVSDVCENASYNAFNAIQAVSIHLCLLYEQGTWWYS